MSSTAHLAPNEAKPTPAIVWVRLVRREPHSWREMILGVEVSKVLVVAVRFSEEIPNEENEINNDNLSKSSAEAKPEGSPPLLHKKVVPNSTIPSPGDTPIAVSYTYTYTNISTHIYTCGIKCNHETFPWHKETLLKMSICLSTVWPPSRRLRRLPARRRAANRSTVGGREEQRYQRAWWSRPLTLSGLQRQRRHPHRAQRFLWNARWRYRMSVRLLMSPLTTEWW